TITGTAIAVTLPYGTSVTSLTPTVTVSTGASYSPTTAQDFSSAKTYTVTAEDGTTTKDYTVTVTVAKNPAKDITDFKIGTASGTITGTAIAVTVPYGTGVTSLTPTVTVSTGASYSPTGAQNFSSAKTYTVTAQDGTTKDYTVTVTVAKNSAKDITAFKIGTASGTISGTTIAVTVPYGTSRTSLTPTVTVSTGASYSPTGAQNFSSAKTYTVTAEDGTTKDYTVTVTVAKNSEKKILSFAVYRDQALHMAGDYIFINEQNKTITIAPNQNWTTNGAYIVVTVSPGATVSPGNTSRISMGTYTAYYTVTAEDGSSVVYTVTKHDYDGGS
ncbi:MAG: DUF5018 domain-containing protein, partial [Spirochaetaceae bacterium]|nr:DUF5018 domain-containing protein [Spirochaetaceae bacterium]